MLGSVNANPFNFFLRALLLSPIGAQKTSFHNLQGIHLKYSSFNSKDTTEENYKRYCALTNAVVARISLLKCCNSTRGMQFLVNKYISVLEWWTLTERATGILYSDYFYIYSYPLTSFAIWLKRFAGFTTIYVAACCFLIWKKGIDMILERIVCRNSIHSAQPQENWKCLLCNEPCKV